MNAILIAVSSLLMSPYTNIFQSHTAQYLAEFSQVLHLQNVSFLESIYKSWKSTVFRNPLKLVGPSKAVLVYTLHSLENNNS